MPMPNYTEQDKQDVAEFVAAILEATRDAPTVVVLNGLISAYFTAALERGHAADTPQALRQAAKEIERNMEKILVAKAMHDAQSATMQ